MNEFAQHLTEREANKAVSEMYHGITLRAQRSEAIILTGVYGTMSAVFGGVGGYAGVLNLNQAQDAQQLRAAWRESPAHNPANVSATFTAPDTMHSVLALCTEQAIAQNTPPNVAKLQADGALHIQPFTAPAAKVSQTFSTCVADTLQQKHDVDAANGAVVLIAMGAFTAYFAVKAVQSVGNAIKAHARVKTWEGPPPSEGLHI